MPLKLNDPATKLLYEALTEVDQKIEIPPDRKNECKCKAYVGLLSNITEHAAERYVKSGGNLLRVKAEDETQSFLQQKNELKNETSSLSPGNDSDHVDNAGQLDQQAGWQ